ncbi:MAG TPA: hypothetical protein VH143_11210 [Kofleriaceae bacterium]|nr:hypothetical protein [Kofleriaceae bacterium]
MDVGYNTSNTTSPDAPGPPTAFGTPRWAIDLGTAYRDVGAAVAINSTGDVVAAGTFGGPNNSIGISTPTGFVTQRAASDGSERWTASMTTLADLSYVDVAGVAIDPTDDSVVVTGSYIGSVDFGGQTLSLDEPPEPNHSDMFLARYTSTGVLQWARGLSPTTDAAGTTIATDSAGHAIVAGPFTGGSLTFGNAEYSEPSIYDSAAFLVAYDSAGDQLWGQGFVADDGSGGSNGPDVASVTVDANDDVLVTGAFRGPTSLGGVTLTSATSAAFLERFASDGSYVASHVVPTGGTYPTQVVVDTSGQVLVQTVPSTPGVCGLYAVDGSDDDLWSASLADHGDSGPQQRSLVATPSGSALSSAWIDSATSYMEVVAFDSSGHGSASQFGSRTSGQPFDTTARATAAASTGAIAFTGDFAGALQFGGSVLTNQISGAGSDVDPFSTDVFVVLVDPAP